MGARLGQNFLADPAWLRRVAEAAAPRAEDSLLEIGGGPGQMTALLADSGCRLRVVEVDPRWAEKLRRRFDGHPRVEVVEGDILTADTDALLGGDGWARGLADGPLPRVFGNLPYYISGPILAKLFAWSDRIQDATIMLQREVADRLLAAPGTRQFGLLSASAQILAAPARLLDLPPGAFRPRPEVGSTLLRLRFPGPRGLAPENSGERDRIISFLRVCFAHKRKRLAKNLQAWAAPERVLAALRAAGVDANIRAEQCAPATLVALQRALG